MKHRPYTENCWLGSRCNWWELSANRTNATNFCNVNNNGNANNNNASNTGIRVPL